MKSFDKWFESIILAILTFIRELGLSDAGTPSIKVESIAQKRKAENLQRRPDRAPKPQLDYAGFITEEDLERRFLALDGAERRRLADKFLEIYPETVASGVEGAISMLELELTGKYRVRSYARIIDALLGRERGETAMRMAEAAEMRPRSYQVYNPSREELEKLIAIFDNKWPNERVPDYKKAAIILELQWLEAEQRWPRRNNDTERSSD